MLIRYDGPADSIDVYPYGEHRRGEVKDYPREFGGMLLATARKNLFMGVDEKDEVDDGPPDSIVDLLAPVMVDHPPEAPDEPATTPPQSPKRRRKATEA